MVYGLLNCVAQRFAKRRVDLASLVKQIIQGVSNQLQYLNADNQLQNLLGEWPLSE